MKLFQTGGHVPETNYIFMVNFSCSSNNCSIDDKMYSVLRSCIMVRWFRLYLCYCQGDFVDRGYNSLEVFTILLLLKARYSCTRAILVNSLYFVSLLFFFFGQVVLPCICLHRCEKEEIKMWNRKKKKSLFLHFVKVGFFFFLFCLLFLEILLLVNHSFPPLQLEESSLYRTI